MHARSRTPRTVLTTAAAAVAVPAVILATAGTAHATVRGLDVNFEPLLGGIGIRVEVQDTVGAGKQNCSYDARPEGESLLPPSHKDFVLGLQRHDVLANPRHRNGHPLAGPHRVHIRSAE